MNDTDAARSLITLAAPQDPYDKDTLISTPPRRKAISSIEKMVYESPDQTRQIHIMCKGTKRPRENLVLALYDAGDAELAVPFIRGEDPKLFFQRRNAIIKAALEADMREGRLLHLATKDGVHPYQRQPLATDPRLAAAEAVHLRRNPAGSHQIHLHSMEIRGALPQLLQPSLASSLPEHQAHLSCSSYKHTKLWSDLRQSHQRHGSAPTQKQGRNATPKAPPASFDSLAMIPNTIPATLTSAQRRLAAFERARSSAPQMDTILNSVYLYCVVRMHR